VPKQNSNNSDIASEPRVGVFWFFQRMLIIDITSVSQAEPYGDHVGHAASHVDYWAEFNARDWYRRTWSTGTSPVAGLAATSVKSGSGFVPTGVS
jgi:hypothetical protein